MTDADPIAFADIVPRADVIYARDDLRGASAGLNSGAV